MNSATPEWLRSFQPTSLGLDSEGQPYRLGAVYCITDGHKNVIVGRYIGESETGEYQVQVLARRLSRTNPAPKNEIVCIGGQCHVEQTIGARQNVGVLPKSQPDDPLPAPDSGLGKTLWSFLGCWVVVGGIAAAVSFLALTAIIALGWY